MEDLQGALDFGLTLAAGAALVVVVLLGILLFRAITGRKCPHCRKRNRRKAIVCRYCGKLV